MNGIKRILQANLNNQGGAFSLMYQAQVELYPDIVFDYFSPNKFVVNEVYKNIQTLEGKIFDKEITGNKFIKQYKIYHGFKCFLKDDEYKIVHIHADTAWKSAAYALAARKAGVKKIIIHSHSSGINGHYRSLNYFLHWLMRPVVNKTADCRCACSRKAAYWMYRTEDGIEFIQNGVDVNKFRFNAESRTLIRSKFEIQDEKVVVGTVGDFSWAKNPDFISNIIVKLAANKNYVFLLIGDGPGKGKLEKYFDKKQISDRVIFTGQISNLSIYLNAMDIFLLPSRFEGLPMSALEAQVNGLYTIVSANLTPETMCSKKYIALELNVRLWIKTINRLNLNYDRNNWNDYLTTRQVGIHKTVEHLKKIYQ